ncbi:MAG: Hsp20/alpha crystallin family protein [Candidatus Omnitrophica bacterium]|nr:Hsp20/alpha crystallin family protein [Candidatus Omnitrophota bacterium]
MLEKHKLFAKNERMPTILPVASIYDQNQKIVLAIEMAGVDKSTIDVCVEGNILAIKAIKRKENISGEYQALYQERQNVEYRRSFELNAEVDREGIEAEYKNGILKLSLTLAKRAQPKKIEIKT